MHNEPYVLLGCASGNVQVISLLSATHDLATGAVEAQTMELQPYEGTTCEYMPFAGCSNMCSETVQASTRALPGPTQPVQ